MKRWIFLTCVMIAAFGMVASAAAAPYMPPLGPLYIKFDNREQLSATNSIVSPSGANEGNWGVFIVSTIAAGNITGDPFNFDPISPPLWTDQTTDGGQITGIFGGLTVTDPGPPFNSSGGELWIYWDEPGLVGGGTMVDLATDAFPVNRTGDFAFTGFTDGILLAKIEFVPGAIVADPTVTVTGTVTPTTTSFTGLANSYGNVADVNGDGIIDSNDGAWATLLNGDYFDTLLGPNTADLKFRNIYEGPLASWNGPAGTDIIGAGSSDPARAYAVPEPASMMLLGSGLAGLAGLARSRRREKKM